MGGGKPTNADISGEEKDKDQEKVKENGRGTAAKKTKRVEKKVGEENSFGLKRQERSEKEGRRVE